MAERKYTSEFGLNMVAGWRILLQQSELQLLNGATGLPPIYIYMITRRPRIMLDPSNFEITDEYVSGRLRIQREDQLDIKDFKVPNKMGRSDLNLVCDYPYTEYKLLDSNQNCVSSGKIALLLTFFGPAYWDLLPLEVLYVGQSYGIKKIRTAIMDPEI